jgi:hypothetical protein
LKIIAFRHSLKLSQPAYHELGQPTRCGIIGVRNYRLYAERLMRAFIGWPTARPTSASVSTLGEIGKRPNREREYLVGEHTRIINRLKSCLVRHGIRDFDPTLHKLPHRLAKLHTGASRNLNLPQSTVSRPSSSSRAAH